MRLLERTRSYLARERRFTEAGATTLSSFVQFPILRRLPNGRNEIALKNGFTIGTPIDVELVALFEENYVYAKLRD